MTPGVELVLTLAVPLDSAAQVSALETIVGKGSKVVDADVVTLTEALMNELVKLDSIAADGEVKVQRRMQVSAPTPHQSIAASRTNSRTPPPEAQSAADTDKYYDGA